MCRSGEGSERFARVVVAVSALYSVRKGETIPILLVKKGNFQCKHGRKGTEQQEKGEFGRDLFVICNCAPSAHTRSSAPKQTRASFGPSNRMCCWGMRLQQNKTTVCSDPDSKNGDGREKNNTSQPFTSLPEVHLASDTAFFHRRVSHLAFHIGSPCGSVLLFMVCLCV